MKDWEECTESMLQIFKLESIPLAFYERLEEVYCNAGHFLKIIYFLPCYQSLYGVYTEYSLLQTF